MFLSKKISLLNKLKLHKKINDHNMQFVIYPLLKNKGEIYGAILRQLLFKVTSSYKIKGFKVYDKNNQIKYDLYNKIPGLYEIFLFVLENCKKVLFNNIGKEKQHTFLGCININKDGEYFDRDILINSENLKVIDQNIKLFTIYNRKNVDISKIEFLIDINEDFIEKHNHKLIQDFQPINTMYVPVTKVFFYVENDFIENNEVDKLFLNVETNKSVTAWQVMLQVLDFQYNTYKILYENFLLTQNLTYKDDRKNLYIYNLDISTRLKNCLVKLKVNNLVELSIKYTYQQIKEIKDLGKKTFEELLECMKKHKLNFKEK